MSTTFNLITLLAVVAAGAVGLAVFKAKLAGQQSAGAKFKQKTLLTPNELEFLGRLEAAAPELRFFPQVAMGALLDPAVPRSDGKAYYRLRGMFSQKIVDFVAQRRSDGAVVAIIELDDRTHNSGQDAKRDEMLQSAGYRIVRWHSKTKPDAAAIRAELCSAPSGPAAVGPTGGTSPQTALATPRSGLGPTDLRRERSSSLPALGRGRAHVAANGSVWPAQCSATGDSSAMSQAPSTHNGTLAPLAYAAVIVKPLPESP